MMFFRSAFPAGYRQRHKRKSRPFDLQPQPRGRSRQHQTGHVKTGGQRILSRNDHATKHKNITVLSFIRQTESPALLHRRTNAAIRKCCTDVSENKTAFRTSPAYKQHGRRMFGKSQQTTVPCPLKSGHTLHKCDLIGFHARNVA